MPLGLPLSNSSINYAITAGSSNPYTRALTLLLRSYKNYPKPSYKARSYNYNLIIGSLDVAFVIIDSYK